jgi:hypothetical protein
MSNGIPSEQPGVPAGNSATQHNRKGTVKWTAGLGPSGWSLHRGASSPITYNVSKVTCAEASEGAGSAWPDLPSNVVAASNRTRRCRLLGALITDGRPAGARPDGPSVELEHRTSRTVRALAEHLRRLRRFTRGMWAERMRRAHRRSRVPRRQRSRWNPNGGKRSKPRVLPADTSASTGKCDALSSHSVRNSG